MQVDELIVELQKFDGDAEVWIEPVDITEIEEGECLRTIRVGGTMADNSAMIMAELVDG